MQLYAPTSTTPKRKAFRAPALASLEGARIGILENGKLNAEEMLNEVAQLFVAAPRLHGPHAWPPSATPARRRRPAPWSRSRRRSISCSPASGD